MHHARVAFIALCSACSSGSLGTDLHDCSVEAAGVATLVEVAWTSDTAGSTWVEFGPTAEREHSSPRRQGDAGPGGEVLLGLHALSDVYVRVVHETDHGVRSVCEPDVASTSTGPAELPAISITVDAPDVRSDAGYVLASILSFHTPALVIFDRGGDIVWSRAVEEHVLAPDVQFALGSNDILYNTFDDMRLVDIGGVRRETLRGEEVDTFRQEMAHHAFAQTPDGCMAWPAATLGVWNGEDVVGDRLMEQCTGEAEARVLFDSWEAFEPSQSTCWEERFYPQGRDWTHANAVNYDAATETYLVSFACIDTIVQVDRSGSLVRSFGVAGTHPVADRSTRFQFPHDPTLTPDGTLLVVSTDDDETIALEYAVDTAAGELREVWSCGLGWRAHALGMATRLPNGNTLLDYGTVGVLAEVTPDCDTVWEAQLPIDSWFGQARLVADLYAGR